MLCHPAWPGPAPGFIAALQHLGILLTEILLFRTYPAVDFAAPPETRCQLLHVQQ